MEDTLQCVALALHYTILDGTCIATSPTRTTRLVHAAEGEGEERMESSLCCRHYPIVHSWVSSFLLFLPLFLVLPIILLHIRPCLGLRWPLIAAAPDHAD